MKLLTFFIFLFTLFLACNNKQTESRKHLTPLSAWLIKNEDSLYNYMKEFIKGDPRLKDSNTIYTEYTIDSLLFKKLNNNIANYDSCIVVHINYKPKEKLPFEILLTSDYKKGCISSIDKIFSDIDSLRHFRVVKYRPAYGPFGGFINEQDTIMPEQIKFGVHPSAGKYNLIIYVPKPITQDTKDYLIQGILGEEVLEKRINKINYKLLKDTALMTKNVEDIRFFFNIKNE